MKLLATLASTIAIVSAAALVRSSDARAAWCWPSCSGYAVLGPATSTNNGCWYSGGEVCSGWNYWFANGIDKKCTPLCLLGYTQARVLYGFENTSTIRGRFTDYAGIFRIRPPDVSMGGYLRAQVNWWPYYDGRFSYSSYLQVAAII
jgi:hypothetical protein